MPGRVVHREPGLSGINGCERSDNGKKGEEHPVDRREPIAENGMAVEVAHLFIYCSRNIELKVKKIWRKCPCRHRIGCAGLKASAAITR